MVRPMYLLFAVLGIESLPIFISQMSFLFFFLKFREQEWSLVFIKTKFEFVGAIPLHNIFQLVKENCGIISK